MSIVSGKICKPKVCFFSSHSTCKCLEPPSESVVFFLSFDLKFSNLLFTRPLLRPHNTSQIRRALLVDVSVWSALVDQTLTSKPKNYPKSGQKSVNSDLCGLAHKALKFRLTARGVSFPDYDSQTATQAILERTVGFQSLFSCSVVYSSVGFALRPDLLSGFLSAIMSIKSRTFCGTTLV